MREKYRIISNEWIAPGIHEMLISAPPIAEAARPGQFVNIYIPGGTMLLPRPLSVSDVRGTDIAVIYKTVGRGTSALADLGRGDFLDVLGPNGTGYFDYGGSITDLKKDVYGENRSTTFLVGGGLGIPPLLYAARAIKAARHGRARIVAFLGYADEPWYSSQLKNHCDYVFSSSDTPGKGDFHGNAVAMMAERAPEFLGDREMLYSPVLMCGPEIMMTKAQEYCVLKGLKSRINMEARMGCGYGVCRGCARPFKVAVGGEGPYKEYSEEKSTMKKICVHGPAFWGDEIIWNRP